MKRLFIALSAISIVSSAAFADPIDDRQALMKERGKLVGEMAKMVKGEAPFDAAIVAASLKGLQDNAARFDVATLFPKGSETGGDTTVSPKIWEDPNGFAEHEKAFEDAINAAAGAPAADLDALKGQVGAIGKACGGCHQAYRIKKG